MKAEIIAIEYCARERERETEEKEKRKKNKKGSMRAKRNINS